jgi:formate dehydrogenase iron-sulfur subunit
MGLLDHRLLGAEHDRAGRAGLGIKGCPFNIPRISEVDRKAYKCTLCSDRVAVGQVLAQAGACPTATRSEHKVHLYALRSTSEIPRRGRAGPGLRQDLPDRRDHVRHQGGDDRAGP